MRILMGLKRNFKFVFQVCFIAFLETPSIDISKSIFIKIKDILRAEDPKKSLKMKKFIRKKSCIWRQKRHKSYVTVDASHMTMRNKKKKNWFELIFELMLLKIFKRFLVFNE